MATTDRGGIIRLQGGPWDRWQFFEQDFLDSILAAQRMGRTTTIGQGVALGYTPADGWIWTWAGGRNCHPLERVAPEQLLPYGSPLAPCIPRRVQRPAGQHQHQQIPAA